MIAYSRRKASRAGRIFAACFAAAVACGLAGNASADDYYGYSPFSFVPMPGNPGFEFNGFLVQASGNLVLPLNNLHPGERICGMTFTGRDNDGANNFDVKLFRRVARPGGSVNTLPQLMGRVQSTGTNPLFIDLVDNTIQRNLLDPDDFTYYVGMDLAPGNSLEIVAFGLIVQPTCP